MTFSRTTQNKQSYQNYSMIKYVSTDWQTSMPGDKYDIFFEQNPLGIKVSQVEHNSKQRAPNGVFHF